MKFLSTFPRWILIAGSAFIAAIAMLAAMHLSADRPAAVSLHQPKPIDRLAEPSGEKTRRASLAEIDKLAEQKLGPMPKPIAATELARMSAEAKAFDPVAEVRRIREIRRTQGSAAAVAAMKSSNRPVTH
ncbi:MAG: hypothetical protein ACT4PZ_21860 [Panacagrimonas sp.]